jgi:transposase, IS605 orfB family
MVIIKGYKIRLIPTLEQEILIKKSIGVSRFVYNWCLDKQLNSDKFISDNELRKELTKLKRTDSLHWLNEVGCNVIKQSAKDLCNAYKKFFNKISNKPRFKKKGVHNSFYVNYESMKKTKNGVRCEKIGDIKTSEKLPKLVQDKHYMNPHIVFDGKYYYITFSMEINIKPIENTSKIIGIDLGIKSFAVCSDGTTYKNINKTHTVRKLTKKLRRLQRCISKKYLKNKIGNKFIKTTNIIKLEHKIKLIHRRIKNIRENYIHQITSHLVKTKPSKLVIEDLNIKGMLKNKHLSKAIAEQCFYKFTSVLGYKCDWNNIELIKADRFYPSSKICSCCGSIKKDLKLKDRTYKCGFCGLEMDRDYNASINLANYKLA